MYVYTGGIANYNDPVALPGMPLLAQAPLKPINNTYQYKNSTGSTFRVKLLRIRVGHFSSSSSTT